MNKKSKNSGLPPGSVVYTGNRKIEKVQIHYLHYDENNLEEKTLHNQGKIVFHHSDDNKVDWYDIRGIHDSALIEQIGAAFNIHSLILEDVSDIDQRPKFEEYENGIFIIVKALSFDKARLKISTEQVGIYFKKWFVVTFQETESDLFNTIRKRIQNGKGRIRQRGSDYFAYALVDVIVDHYFIVLEDIELEIESLEEKVLEKQDAAIKSKIHLLRKELLTMRKSIAPLREAVSRFAKSDSPFIEEKTVVYLRDLYDHTKQVMDSVESFRDSLNGLNDLFISEVSFKMNQVIQMLTIVSTIFIPLTFLAGIYGMNFDNMPELHWEYGYFILWALMAVIFVGLLLYFKKKKWF